VNPAQVSSALWGTSSAETGDYRAQLSDRDSGLIIGDFWPTRARISLSRVLSRPPGGLEFSFMGDAFFSMGMFFSECHFFQKYCFSVVLLFQKSVSFPGMGCFQKCVCFRIALFSRDSWAVFEFSGRDWRAFKFRFGNHGAKCQALSVVQMNRTLL